MGKKQTRKKRQTRKPPFARRRAPACAPFGPDPVLVTVFFSRKMVNILNVDRHRQSVAWIKLCIIENVFLFGLAGLAGLAGGGRNGTSPAARSMREIRGAKNTRFRTN